MVDRFGGVVGPSVIKPGMLLARLEHELAKSRLNVAPEMLSEGWRRSVTFQRQGLSRLREGH